MTKREAQEERARLQILLDDYEEGRRDQAEGTTEPGSMGKQLRTGRTRPAPGSRVSSDWIVGRDQA